MATGSENTSGGGSKIKNETPASKRALSIKKNGNGIIGTYTAEQLSNKFSVQYTSSFTDYKAGDVVPTRGVIDKIKGTIMTGTEITNKNIIESVETTYALNGGIRIVKFKDGHSTNAENLNAYVLRKK